MKKIIISVLLLYFIFRESPVNAQTENSPGKISSRPRIGLTLSGGGAKGLAHIGLMKMLDSAGLSVDYVTGTSMGSVVGGLYAAGYSGKEIEKIATDIDWDLLFTNRSALRSFIMEEKGEYQKYAVELPWEGGKFHLAGVLESQELWLKFSELFFPVYGIKDFSKMPRGFECIGSNISTGEAVVLKKGEIVSAIRASMAIPTIFKPIELDSIKLVDGGIVRNFPVKEAIDMGADFVIGSNVSGDLMVTEEINNLFDVVTQISTFREDIDNKQQQKLCNVYVFHPLKDFGTSSFSSAEEIIRQGTEKAMQLYPFFKRMADSLNALYGPPIKPVFNRPDSVRISDYEVRGLKATTAKFFFQRNKIEKNKYYTAAQLAEEVRKAFGTRYYARIIYSLQPQPDGSAKIIYDVQENPLTYIKLILNYNSFQGVGLVANLTGRNFLTPLSRSMLTLNIGDNMKLRGEHLQLFGRGKNISVNTEVQGEIINDFPIYTNFIKNDIYRQSNLKADITIGSAYKRKLFIGAGTRWEAVHFFSDISSHTRIKGNNTFLNSYGVIRFNSLTNAIYPIRGTKMDVEGGYIYSQEAAFKESETRIPIKNTDSLGFGIGNFARIKFNVEHYIPLTKKFTLLTQSQAGINFTKKQTLTNDYFIGGLTSTFRNQVVFAGLREATVNAGSVAAIRFSLRYKIISNIYILGHFNALAYNFAGNYTLYDASLLTGYGLTLAVHYLGPLQISVMYSDQYRKVLSYVNLGIPF
ncbi:MAG: patatin-like phospholipase family protein [Bacteroidota bacterium]